MKALIISLTVFLSFVSHSVWANTDINEYKVDLYYANGMGMKLDEDEVQRDWKISIYAL
jgi:hypothetical protein